MDPSNLKKGVKKICREVTINIENHNSEMEGTYVDKITYREWEKNNRGKKECLRDSQKFKNK